MYHVYKHGYNTLPNLKKISKKDIFEKNKKESNLIQKEKQVALKNQKFFFEIGDNSKFYNQCKEFIKEYYPIRLKSENYFEIAKEIDEDLIIHTFNNVKDYVSSIHVCLPSGWKPEEKIGKTFREIHEHVPMNLDNSEKLAKAIMNGIFERFVWSIVFEEKYNYHPQYQKKAFDIENPEIFVKIERQVTVGFGNFCLFILRQYLIKDFDRISLYNSLKNMNEKEKEYKDLNEIEPILEHLK